jgi:hypothetical protein
MKGSLDNQHVKKKKVWFIHFNCFLFEKSFQKG